MKAIPFLLLSTLIFSVQSLNDCPAGNRTNINTPQNQGPFIDTIKLVISLKNYCFIDGSCTGFIKTDVTIHGNADNESFETPTTSFLVDQEGEVTVPQIDLKEASGQQIIDQFMDAVSIVSHYQQTTNDRAREFPMSYFFTNIADAPESIHGYIERESDKQYAISIANLSSLFSLNFSNKTITTYQKQYATIKMAGNDNFTVSVDSVFFDRKLKWWLAGERIPMPEK